VSQQKITKTPMKRFDDICMDDYIPRDKLRDFLLSLRDEAYKQGIRKGYEMGRIDEKTGKTNTYI